MKMKKRKNVTNRYKPSENIHQCFLYPKNLSYYEHKIYSKFDK